jgi:ABC-type polysaccharide/polyol phosphate transport system ATPase subunit
MMVDEKDSEAMRALQIRPAKRADEIIAFAEVEKFIDAPVKHYSSGMNVRLALAVAAHLDQTKR